MEPLSPQLMNRLVFAVVMHGLTDSQTNLALNVLADAVTHPNPQVREMAVVALADLTVPPGRRMPPLAVALTDDTARVRRRAARAVGDQGLAAVTALPQLLAGLKDADTSVRRDCAGAIGRIGPAAHAAAAGLVSLLGEPECRTRAVAAAALRRIGRGAVPALLDAARSPDDDFRERCVALAARIAPADPAVLAAQAANRDDILPLLPFPLGSFSPLPAAV